jgi:hypothetical protein
MRYVHNAQNTWEFIVEICFAKLVRNFAKRLAKKEKVVYNIYCLMCDEAGGG